MLYHSRMKQITSTRLNQTAFQLISVCGDVALWPSLGVGLYFLKMFFLGEYDSTGMLQYSYQ